MKNKSGRYHWLLQRLSALLLFITLTMAAFFAHAFRNNSIAQWHSTLANPIYAIAINLLILTGIYHAALGLQTIIEDYISQTMLQKVCIIGVNVLCLALAAITLILTYKIMSFNP